MSELPRSDAASASPPGRLVVLSGPSGVGKSRIRQDVVRRTAAQFSVSATTRRPRVGEVDGRDYRFVDRTAFEAMIAENRLLEWAEVFGQYYGTPAEPVRRALAAGRTVLLEIDVQGARQVRRAMPDAAFVLIVPPDDEELRRRLAGRGTEDADALVQRLATAQKELAAARNSAMYDYEIVNDDLETAVDEVVAIIRGLEQA
jgi:guanylate kinase